MSKLNTKKLLNLIAKSIYELDDNRSLSIPDSDPNLEHLRRLIISDPMIDIVDAPALITYKNSFMISIENVFFSSREKTLKFLECIGAHNTIKELQNNENLKIKTIFYDYNIQKNVDLIIEICEGLSNHMEDLMERCIRYYLLTIQGFMSKIKSYIKNSDKNIKNVKIYMLKMDNGRKYRYFYIYRKYAQNLLHAGNTLYGSSSFMDKLSENNMLNREYTCYARDMREISIIKEFLGARKNLDIKELIQTYLSYPKPINDNHSIIQLYENIFYKQTDGLILIAFQAYCDILSELLIEIEYKDSSDYDRLLFAAKSHYYVPIKNKDQNLQGVIDENYKIIDLVKDPANLYWFTYIHKELGELDLEHLINEDLKAYPIIDQDNPLQPNINKMKRIQDSHKDLIMLARPAIERIINRSDFMDRFVMHYLGTSVMGDHLYNTLVSNKKVMTRIRYVSYDKKTIKKIEKALYDEFVGAFKKDNGITSTVYCFEKYYDCKVDFVFKIKESEIEEYPPMFSLERDWYLTITKKNERKMICANNKEWRDIPERNVAILIPYIKQFYNIGLSLYVGYTLLDNKTGKYLTEFEGCHDIPMIDYRNHIERIICKIVGDKSLPIHDFFNSVINYDIYHRLTAYMVGSTRRVIKNIRDHYYDIFGAINTKNGSFEDVLTEMRYYSNIDLRLELFVDSSEMHM